MICYLIIFYILNFSIQFSILIMLFDLLSSNPKEEP